MASSPAAPEHIRPRSLTGNNPEPQFPQPTPPCAGRPRARWGPFTCTLLPRSHLLAALDIHTSAPPVVDVKLPLPKPFHCSSGRMVAAVVQRDSSRGPETRHLANILRGTALEAPPLLLWVEQQEETHPQPASLSNNLRPPAPPNRVPVTCKTRGGPVQSTHWTCALPPQSPQRCVAVHKAPMELLTRPPDAACQNDRMMSLIKARTTVLLINSGILPNPPPPLSHQLGYASE